MTTINYKLLTASVADAEKVQTWKRACSWKCASFLVVGFLLVVILLLLYSCHSLNANNLCCLFNKRGRNFMKSSSGEKMTVVERKVVKRHLPNAIIIGVRKGGTRAMIEYLSLHPKIITVRPEVHFFDRDDNYSRGMDWYRKLMPYTSDDELTIEKTPSYFTTPIVPKLIYEMNPKVKLILLVRDPVERAISDYTQIYVKSLSHGKHNQKPFAILAIDRRGLVKKHYVAVQRSIYYKHLSRWLKYFSLDNFLVLKTADLIHNPFETVQKAEKFLGLEHRILKSSFYFNATKGFYCMNREEGRHCLSSSKGRPHVPVDNETIWTLRAFFKPLNQKFYRLVGEDFGWDES